MCSSHIFLGREISFERIGVAKQHARNFIWTYIIIFCHCLRVKSIQFISQGHTRWSRIQVIKKMPFQITINKRMLNAINTSIKLLARQARSHGHEFLKLVPAIVTAFWYVSFNICLDGCWIHRFWGLGGLGRYNEWRMKRPMMIDRECKYEILRYLQPNNTKPID